VLSFNFNFIIQSYDFLYCAGTIFSGSEYLWCILSSILVRDRVLCSQAITSDTCLRHMLLCSFILLCTTLTTVLLYLGGQPTHTLRFFLKLRNIKKNKQFIMISYSESFKIKWNYETGRGKNEKGKDVRYLALRQNYNINRKNSKFILLCTTLTTVLLYLGGQPTQTLRFFFCDRSHELEVFVGPFFFLRQATMYCLKMILMEYFV
jgi:predicted small integral membrane protein